jgi:phospholipid/cholesterol/gamma-HCH transport system substrate-binding protein
MSATRTPTPSAAARPARWIVLATAAIALIAVAIIVIGGGSTYTLHATFTDASELVRGDSVELGGRGIGSVTDIGVTADGQATVTLSISDSAVTPLHADTRAQIRALGQAGLTNRYVALSPGPASAPELASGATLPTTQTSSLVNYDALLDTFGRAQRADLQRLIADGAQLYSGSGARSFNQLLGTADPALQKLAGFTTQLADDRVALANMIDTGATTASAIAGRDRDLMAAIGNTATTFGVLATQSQAIADALGRAPAVLGEARVTLGEAATAVSALRPALANVPATAAPLTGFLRRLNTVLPAATPVVSRLRGLLPNLRSTLTGLNVLAPTAVPALNSAATALKVARPIVRVFRFYGSDLLLGVFQGLAGVATANYDRWGHYARLEFTQPYQSALGGPLSGLLQKPLVPSLFNLREGLTRRCPGGNTPPAPDGSNPWVPDTSICTPADDTPLSVDFP